MPDQAPVSEDVTPEVVFDQVLPVGFQPQRGAGGNQQAAQHAQD